MEAVNKAIAELSEEGTLTELSEKYPLERNFSREMTLEELTGKIGQNKGG